MKKQSIKKKPSIQKIDRQDLADARIQLLEDEVSKMKKFMSYDEFNVYQKEIDNSTVNHAKDAVQMSMDINTNTVINTLKEGNAPLIKFAKPEELYDEFMCLISKNKIEHGIAIEAAAILVKMLRGSIENEIKENDIRINALHKSIEKAMSIR